ncbi:MAG: hypothetical protein WBV69_12640 [Candidatus Sulfotelmatobacter sp.]
MADSTESVGSWPGFVAQLNTTFNIVRDAFGYTLPGAVFLGIGLVCQSYTLCQVKCLLWPYTLPPWAAFIALIAVCYAAGNVMAATTYMVPGLAKYVVWMIDRHHPTDTANHGVTNITNAAIQFNGHDLAPQATRYVTSKQARNLPAGLSVTRIADPPEASWRDWLVSNPTEVSARTLEIRFKHPELLNTLDRRETLNVMGGSMAAALLAGYCVFCRWHWSFSSIILCGGFISIVQFLTGQSHLRRVLQAVHFANVTTPPDPNFPKLFSDFLTEATALLRKFAQ